MDKNLEFTEWCYAKFLKIKFFAKFDTPYWGKGKIIMLLMEIGGILQVNFK